MYIDIVPNRNSPPAVLLRESVREGGKVVKKTVGNLTGLPPEIIAAVRLALSGRAQVPAESLVEVVRSRPHGHVKAIRLAMERLGMAGLLSSRPCRDSDRDSWPRIWVGIWAVHRARRTGCWRRAA